MPANNRKRQRSSRCDLCLFEFEGSELSSSSLCRYCLLCPLCVAEAPFRLCPIHTNPDEASLDAWRQRAATYHLGQAAAIGRPTKRARKQPPVNPPPAQPFHLNPEGKRYTGRKRGREPAGDEGDDPLLSQASSLRARPPSPPPSPNARARPPSPPPNPPFPAPAGDPDSDLKLIAEHPPIPRTLWHQLQRPWAQAVAFKGSKLMQAIENGSDADLVAALRDFLLLPAQALGIPKGCASLSAQLKFQMRRLVDPHAPEPRLQQPAQQQHLQQHRPCDPRVRVARKLVREGKLGDAARLLADWNELADPDLPEVREELKRLHPLSEDDAVPVLPKDVRHISIHMTKDDLLKLLATACRKHSSGGPSGWTYHLIRAACREDAARNAILALINLILAGAIPEGARKLLLASRLVPFRKPNNGVRPIAVGEAFYRLAASFAVRSVVHKAVDVLGPIQLGVGVRGGVEAAVHVLQEAILDPERKSVILSLDIENAFNSLSRAFMLKSLFAIPEFRPIYSLVHWAYRSPSDLLVLKGGRVLYTLRSSRGVRQGDPLGSLLFAISMLVPYAKISSSLPGSPPPVAIIDDLNLISRDPQTLLKAYDVAKQVLEAAGLRLQPLKTKLLASGDLHPDLEATARREGWQCTSEAATLLGAPVGPDDEAVSRLALEAVERHRHLLETITAPGNFSIQEALLLLRVCVAPRLIYLARVVRPSCFRRAAEAFDVMLRRALESLLSLHEGSLPDSAWRQALLPLKLGGLGLQSVAALSMEAWFSSQALAAPHLDARFPKVAKPRETDLAQALNALKSRNPNHRIWRLLPGDVAELLPCDGRQSFFSTHPQQAYGLQSKLSQLRHQATYNSMLRDAKRAFEDAPDKHTRDVARLQLARLMAFTAPKAHLWLVTYPSQPDYVLSDHAMTVNLLLRLGLPLFDSRFVADHCPCSPDDPVDLQANQMHWLGNCTLSRVARAKIRRHDHVKRLIAKWTGLLGADVSVEPDGLDARSKKRPDISVQLGQDHLLLDVVVVNPLCKSRLPDAAQSRCQAARRRVADKLLKYRDLAKRQGAELIPLVVEATGGFEERVCKLIRRLKDATKGMGILKPREVVFGLERAISIAVMRGNAAMVQGGLHSVRNVV